MFELALVALVKIGAATGQAHGFFTDTLHNHAIGIDEVIRTAQFISGSQWMLAARSGFVQQGMSAAGGVLGLYSHGLAADRPIRHYGGE